MPTLADRLSVVKPSATLAVSQRAAALRAQGIDVVSFSLGEPDFETPAEVRAAAKRAIDKGVSHYTAVSGLPALREAIAADSFKRRGIEHTPASVVVSVGAKHSLFNLALALFDPGDEVIIPAPYWVSYPEQVRLVGAVPVAVETQESARFSMSPEQLRAAITPKTCAVILCTPSNPTGSAYTADQLRALAAVLRESDVWIVVDEIYSQLTYDDFVATSLLTVAPDLRDRMIIVDGCSKTYAMTGWRIGWILASERVAKACDVIQSQSTTNPTAVAQHAAIAALGLPASATAEMREVFSKRRSRMVAGLNSIPGVSCAMPSGAFYAFANVTQLIGKKTATKTLMSDVDVALYFLEEGGVAVVPGEPFGAPGYVRLSYTTSDDQIDLGISRMRSAATKLT